ncbi:MAG: hypothetical protein IT165_06535 [Bryobacterales bacterium]|nr:hypothetical protein [Bryobacterales bacterium]
MKLWRYYRIGEVVCTPTDVFEILVCGYDAQDAIARYRDVVARGGVIQGDVTIRMYEEAIEVIDELPPPQRDWECRRKKEEIGAERIGSQEVTSK